MKLTPPSYSTRTTEPEVVVYAHESSALTQQIEQLVQQNAQVLYGYDGQTAQRLQADFDNYRKKSLEQIAQSRYDGMADAVTKMMPVLDSIASAKKMCYNSCTLCARLCLCRHGERTVRCMLA